MEKCSWLPVIRRYKFKKVAYLTFQDSAKTSQHINVQSGYFIVTVMVDLRPLHLRTVTELVFTQAAVLNQFCQIDFNCSISLHKDTPCRK